MSSTTPTYTEKDFSYYEYIVKAVQEESTRMNYLDLGQLAFRTCAHTFTHHELTQKEKTCLSAVTRKYISSSLRASARFGEAQAEAARKARSSGEEALRK